MVDGSLALLSDAMPCSRTWARSASRGSRSGSPIGPASSQKTYGYYRAEILAAFVNGVVLCVLVGIVLIEAWRR
jgi:cobalt-zinc-cadmium efflux system protein